MRSTWKMAFLAAAAVVLAAVFSACYSSAGPGWGGPDVSPDRPPDVSPDIAPDLFLDLVPDPIVDIAQDEILPPPDIVDVTPDFPPDVPPDLPPFEGATFVVSNTTFGFMYVRVWWYGEDPTDVEYDLNINSDSYELPESVSIWQPWCTVDCSTVTDPMSCCMDCIPPFANTLIRLEPGESFRVAWDGTVFVLDNEVCECGCYRHILAPDGEYRVSICASPDYVCLSGVDCYEQWGAVYGAGLSDMMVCPEVSFPVPDASGWVIELFF